MLDWQFPEKLLFRHAKISIKNFQLTLFKVKGGGGALIW